LYLCVYSRRIEKLYTWVLHINQYRPFDSQNLRAVLKMCIKADEKRLVYLDLTNSNLNYINFINQPGVGMSEETAEFIDRIAASEDDIEQDIQMEEPAVTKSYDQALNPIEDRYGRPRWVKTRMCYCLHTKLDSCNVVKRNECPSKELDKTQRTSGMWLWASNPDFNNPPPEEIIESTSNEEDSGTIIIG